MDIRNLIAMLSVVLLRRRAAPLNSFSEADPRLAGRCASKAATATPSGAARPARAQNVASPQPIGCNQPVPSSFHGDPNLCGDDT